MLELKTVSKQFNRGTPDEKTALDRICLTVQDGEFISIIGSNGAGKSTLMNVIAGDTLADSGQIILDGRDITYLPEYKRARAIGRLFQDPLKGTAPSMTIEENLALAYGRGKIRGFGRGISKPDAQLFRSKLAALGLGLEDRLKTPMGLLSGGQRQAVTLLMATMARPALLLLDEHTAALDPGTAKVVMEVTERIIQTNQITTLMITHNMQQALAYGTRTIMMDSGHIVVDVSGKERSQLTVDDLIGMFSSKAKETLSDRTLLSDAT